MGTVEAGASSGLRTGLLAMGVRIHHRGMGYWIGNEAASLTMT